MILAHYNGGKNIIFEWRKMLSNCGAVNSFFNACSKKNGNYIKARKNYGVIYKSTALWKN